MAVQYLVAPNSSPVDGVGYPILWGTTAPNGDSHPFKGQPIGATYIYTVGTNQVETWLKVKDDNHDSDWRMVRGILSVKVAYTDFTDGGAAAGTYTFTPTIPLGAFIEFTTVTVHTGFTGDTTAALIVGDGTDTDRYLTGTPSVLAAGEIAVGLPSGTRQHTAAKAPVLTVTGAADFTSIAAGSMTVTLHYAK